MFGIFKAAGSAPAKKEIEQAIEIIKEKYSLGYAQGLIDMAFTLGAITQNERAEYVNAAYNKERAEAAKDKPIYKKKGVYEYRGYFLLKTNNLGDGAPNWSIQKAGAQDLIAKDLTFKAAVAEVDKLCE